MKLLEHQECYELREFGGFWHRCQVSVEKEKVMIVGNLKKLNKLNGENKIFLMVLPRDLRTLLIFQWKKFFGLQISETRTS